MENYFNAKDKLLKEKIKFCGEMLKENQQYIENEEYKTKIQYFDS